ncbi:MAG: hypothetical protein BHV64_11630 [Alistipes sp. 56_sp_Nov_56_25]|nr:MAG: hypothetical protein BHV64_11630 [Alistipes sp. 56_sp_Nov_56_25]
MNLHQIPIPVGCVLYQRKKQQNALKILKDGQRKITLPQNQQMKAKESENGSTKTAQTADSDHLGI